MSADRTAASRDRRSALGEARRSGWRRQENDAAPPPGNDSAEKLVDKKGRPLRGAALKVAQQKKATGKGPRPPQRARGPHGDIAASRRSSSTTKSGDGFLSRLARVW